MCILCVVQRWSRRLASMLPYLVIPLMLLWALSHFLPPGFRFEATSPRIACAAVLLLTLLWYEYILPRLSAWRARRSARLRELRREQAIELHKLRKTATRRCRNCLTPYRDQNPGGGGRFMCSTCGHVSKRPVLELPGQVGNFGEKSRWLCSHFLSTDSSYWLDETHRCLSQENSLSVGCKVGRIVSFFSLVLRWICRRVFGLGSSDDNVSDEGDSKRSKRGQNGGNLQENRTEKARRKAEEKRLARLEKEMLEEEERKQREEVARLVEERRKLRDEKLEAEERSKGVTPVGERDGKKEAEKKRQDRERRREKDRSSNMSNSDCEEIDKRSIIRETGKRKDLDKKGDSIGTCHGTGTNKIVQQSTRQKYFSTVAGNFKGFSGASFFGGSNPSSNVPSVSKVSKTGNGFGNQSYAVKRDGQVGAGTIHKVLPNGDDKSSDTKINRPVSLEKQPPPPAPKKAWHQLFKRNPVSPTPDQTSIASNYQTGPFETYISPPNRYFNTSPIFSQPTLPYPMYTPPSTGLFRPVKDPVPPPSIVDEQEQFEDPSFDPDAIALLGPVSESLDNLPLDLGTGFISSESGKISKPSPIHSPLSRNRVSDDGHKPFSSAVQDSGSNETGPWQLWGAPLTQNSLGSVGGSKSGFAPKEETGAATGFIGDVHSPRHLGGIRPPLPVSVPVSVSVPVQPVHIPMSVPASVPNGESLFLPHSMVGRFGPAMLDTVNHSELSPTHHWSNRDQLQSNQWKMNGSIEAANSTPASPRAESLFSADPAVHSAWLFNQKDAPPT